ncbi:unnamed protein product [Sphenostylis stenocarpa]|uniref:Bifunctional inhibitor/plant lipid transfer protein/seed storage helical domain-containing protein n=1 Tax=Sphenostylis stenocarpa TaxID=92480 RepID=A0AA86SG18_9FABA|nr:unnamed protein product [Sphenostylis stenocarpa]
MNAAAAAAAAAALVVLLAGSGAAGEGCREELISFSACLEYVSYPPNNLTESASERCCEAFSWGVESVCLCYVVRDPLILGFPLNTTRLLSLSSLCPSPFSTSFPFLCSSDSSALPPLTAPTQTLPTSAGGGRSGSGGNGGSSGRKAPILNGGGGTFSHHHHSSNPSSSSTLIPHITFLILFAVLPALLYSRYSFCFQV